ncbi:MAG: glycerol kinase GlpK [Planctomycetaceae bacterium]|nr:glycerol kinase GlpK [Planctomycetaceae bacterium]
MPDYTLALDQGTTSSRSILFRRDGHPAASAQQEFPQLFPQPGHVEHDPEAIWASQLATAREAMKAANAAPGDIAAIGVTNQRETTVLWERDSGKPVANAIVWQSRITAPICARLKSDGLEPLFRERTGLVLDAYFSGTKIAHLLVTIPGLRERAERGEILFGTVDSFLVWRLTGGKQHISDVSNASRTLLFNLHTLEWDDELLKALNIPRAMLPEVRASSEVYGETDPAHFGKAIPIAGIAGDQQAATFGQACFEPGSAKNTYGTGCFLLMNSGTKPIASKHGLLTTVGWKIGDEVVYCLEGSVFVAGAVVQWLRDGLKLVKSASEIEALAASVPDTEGVYIVPAFVGLGAPHWDPDARGTIVGITRGTTQAHLARAALESMAYQTRDVLDAMQQDSGLNLASLKVDGGATANNLMMQFQADLLGVTVQRPKCQETTALGAAYLAGLAVGFWKDRDDIRRNWALDREFKPTADRAPFDEKHARWNAAVQRSLGWAK